MVTRVADELPGENVRGVIQVNRSGDGIGLRAAQGIDQVIAIHSCWQRIARGDGGPSPCSPFDLDSRHLS